MIVIVKFVFVSYLFFALFCFIFDILFLFFIFYSFLFFFSYFFLCFSFDFYFFICYLFCFYFFLCFLFYFCSDAFFFAHNVMVNIVVCIINNFIAIIIAANVSTEKNERNCIFWHKLNKIVISFIYSAIDNGCYLISSLYIITINK